MTRAPLLWISLGLAIFLLSPFWIVAVPGYSPKDKWLATMQGAGNYHFFAKEIYDREGDIDLLVLGDSIMWCGTDTDMIESEFSRKLGRKAVVLSFAANWRGEDLMYLQLKEILAHRRVRMLMLNMPVFSERDDPHQAAAYWWVMGEHADVLKDADPITLARLYAVSLWGMPRHFLSFLRPNAMLDDTHDIRSNTKTGALKEEHGFGYGEFVKPKRALAFDFTPQSIILSDKTAGGYYFTQRPLNDFQSFFLNRIFALAKEHGVHVVVSSPPRLSQARNGLAEEAIDYAKAFPGFVDTATIAPARIFGNLSDDEIKLYFYDEHMNTTGSETYTRAMLPTILYLYEKKKAGL